MPPHGCTRADRGTCARGRADMRQREAIGARSRKVLRAGARRKHARVQGLTLHRGHQKSRREIPAACLHEDFCLIQRQCAVATSDPRPVSERTFCAANSARSFFALSLPSVTDTT